MSTLHLRTTVACPVGQTGGYLQKFFSEHRADGEDARIVLHGSLAFPGATFSRDCTVHIVRAAPSADMVEHYPVQWESVAEGPFPRFTGTLSIRNAEDYESCFLELDGTYQPPLGAVGAAFDATAGHGIAESTGRDLLDRIAGYVEQASRTFEAEKEARRRALCRDVG